MKNKGVLLIYLATFIGCSFDGDKNEPIAPQKEKPVIVNKGDPKNNETGVHVHLFGKEAEFTKNCFNPLQLGTLDAENLVIDGNLEDWDGQGLSFSDYTGDARSGFDLDGFKIAKQDEKLYLSITGKGLLADDEYIYLELYQGYHQDKTIIVLEHIIRVHKNGVQLFNHDHWYDLVSPFIYEGGLAESDGNSYLEMSISIEHFLSGLTTSPLWGMQISTGKENTWHDYTGLVFQTGLTAEGYGQFTLDGCAKDPHVAAPVQFQTVSSQDYSTPISLIRYTHHVIAPILALLPLPIASIPILADKTKAQFSLAAKNMAAHTLGTKSQPKVLHISGNNHSYGIDGKTGFGVDPYPHISGFEKTANKFFHLYFEDALRPGLKNLTTLLAHSQTSKVVREESGLEHWFSHISAAKKWQQKLGILLEFKLGSKALFEAFALEASTKNDFWQSLSLLKPDHLEFISQLHTIYLEAENTLPDPLKGGEEEIEIDLLNKFFLDSDYDGLPKFYESHLNLPDSKFDTDDDYWSDFAEVISGSDPANKASYPEFIYPDGSFGDIVDLLAGKIQSNETNNINTCGSVGAIKSVVGVVGPENLMIAVQHEGFKEDTPPIRWQIDIMNPDEEHTSQIKAVLLEKGYDLLDQNGNVTYRYESPIPSGVYALEVVASLSHLGISSISENMKFKVATFLNDGSHTFCDDTVIQSFTYKR